MFAMIKMSTMKKNLYKLDDWLENDFFALFCGLFSSFLFVFLCSRPEKVIENILITFGVVLFLFLVPCFIIGLAKKYKENECNTYEDNILSDTSTWD